MQRLFLNNFIKPSILHEAVTSKVQQLIRQTYNLPNESPSGSTRLVKNTPKTEEEFSALMAHLESLVPKGANVAQYVPFLAKTLFSPEPSWIVHEDEIDLVPVLKQYAAMQPRLQPPHNDINYFETRQALTQFVTEKSGEVKRKEDMQESEIQEVLKSASIVHVLDDWKVWKLPKGVTPQKARALYLLTSNSRHGSVWCTGRDSGQITSYLDQGDFYVFMQGNLSRYAVSTHQDTSLVIYNPADSPIVDTSGLPGTQNTDNSSMFSSIVEAGASMGIDASVVLNNLSHVPEDIKPLIRELRDNPQTAIFKTVPEKLLNEVPAETQSQMFKLLQRMDKEKFISDLNQIMASGVSGKILKAYAVLTYVVTPYRELEFTEKDFSNMSWTTFNAYVEAHANSHRREMSAGIRQHLKSLLLRIRLSSNRQSK